jgi:hypothetical protein
VALNTERVTEEANGKIAYLRPAYQNPALRGTVAEAVAVEIAEQTTLAIDTPQASDRATAPKPRTLAKARKLVWPRTLPERMKVVATVLSDSATPMTVGQVAARIDAKANAKSQLPEILATLVDFGRAQRVGKMQFAMV